MKKYLYIFLVIVVSALTSWITSPKSTSSNIASPAKDIVYDRIMKTGTIRCGYMDYAPAFNTDPNTGEFYGIFYDVMNEIGANLGLKVEWAVRTNWSEVFEGMETGKYDFLCSDLWMNPSRSKMGDFSTPVYFSGMGIYVRADDNRFSGDWRTLMNNESIKFAAVEGEGTNDLIDGNFPKASRFTLPKNADSTEPLVSVISQKADAHIASDFYAAEFMAHNPGKIKKVANINVFPDAMALPKGEYKLKRMIDNNIEFLHQTGFIEKVLQKHQKYPGSVLRVNSMHREDR